MSDNPMFIEVQKHLGGVDYPAGRTEIVEAAKASGADDAVLQALEALPDREYGDPTEVSEAIAG
ncbi:DUF2795 domain-containing protein [Microbacterium sp. NPDC058345]|uniref:DUF2795 domain-containing protein n=1 Tax=Microbacterium sp. NPDC058345 TaxID=3346455 RepID=UPI003655E166